MTLVQQFDKCSVVFRTPLGVWVSRLAFRGTLLFSLTVNRGRMLIIWSVLLLPNIQATKQPKIATTARFTDRKDVYKNGHVQNRSFRPRLRRITLD